MSNADANTFATTDALERELIWNALAEYRNICDPDHTDTVDAMIARVSSTFSWMRD